MTPANADQSQEAYDLVKAIVKNDLRKVKRIVEKGEVDVNARYYLEKSAEESSWMLDIFLHGMADFTTATPLEYAVMTNHVKIARFLRESGADIQQRDRLGNTLLHWASGMGNTNAVSFLLSEGADPNARNHINMTPQQWATNLENQRILKKKRAGQPLQKLIDAKNYCRNLFSDMSVGVRILLKK